MTCIKYQLFRNAKKYKITPTAMAKSVFKYFLKRGWAMIANERIALRCSAYLWGVAIREIIIRS